MTTTSNIATGPWQQQAEQRLTPDERRAAIRDAIVCRRNIIRLAEVQDIEQIAQRQLLRMEPAVKRLGRLDVLRELRSTLVQADALIKQRRLHIDRNAESMLQALLALDGELNDNQAGAVLGIDHRHVQRAGGLVRAATSEPVPQPVTLALLDRIVTHTLINPIQHRKARQMMNDLLDLDLPLPPRPRPEAV